MRSEEIVVPRPWWFELRNALLMGQLRDRITARDTALFLRNLSRLPVIIDSGSGDPNMLWLARRPLLSVYDAAYLELSIREDQPLAILDGALRAAAQAEGIPLLGD